MPSTVHMLREQWRCSRNAAGERRRGEGLTCGGCNRWLCYWKRQAAALVAGDAVFLLSLSSVLRSLSAFLFFFFFSAFPLSFLFSPLLCISLSVFRSLSSLSSPSSFSSPSPVFIGKNRGGRRGWGGHCAAAPNRPRGTSPSFFHHVASKWVVGVFLRESWRWNRRKNLLLLPLLRVFCILVLGLGFLQLSPYLAIKLQYLCN